MHIIIYNFYYNILHYDTYIYVCIYLILYLHAYVYLIYLILNIYTYN